MAQRDRFRSLIMYMAEEFPYPWPSLHVLHFMRNKKHKSDSKSLTMILLVESIQANLRLFVAFLIALCLLAACVGFVVDGIEGILLYGSLSLFASYLVMARHSSLNPNTWWFLWNGPMIELDFIRPHEEATSWLFENYTSSDYKMFGQIIKFRKTSTAVMFKLMY